MNKRNLQKELEDKIKQAEAAGYRPTLLLHVCCAPCSSYCMEYLTKHFDLTVFFYNPNIDNRMEYEKRVEEEKRLIREMDLFSPVTFVEGAYDPSIFHEAVRGYELDKEGGGRCSICYELRLREAAIFAKQGDFDYFTTSLTISPMKDAQALCSIGEKVADIYGVPYLPSDFKKKNGYKRSVELSGTYGLYRQNYCGCSFSKRDACNRNCEVERMS